MPPCPQPLNLRSLPGGVQNTLHSVDISQLTRGAHATPLPWVVKNLRRERRPQPFIWQVVRERGRDVTLMQRQSGSECCVLHKRCLRPRDGTGGDHDASGDRAGESTAATRAGGPCYAMFTGRGPVLRDVHGPGARATRCSRAGEASPRNSGAARNQGMVPAAPGRVHVLAWHGRCTLANPATCGSGRPAERRPPREVVGTRRVRNS